MLSLQANNSIAIKKKLRENLLRKRKGLSKSEVIECSVRVFKNFQKKFYESNFYKVRVIAAYLAINNELDTWSILNLLQREKIKTALQKVLIIPLLGFDEHGNRLGYGLGYYDKTLSKLPNAKKIGIGYSFQQVKNIPSEPHDVKLDLIITDNQIIMPNL